MNKNLRLRVQMSLRGMCTERSRWQRSFRMMTTMICRRLFKSVIVLLRFSSYWNNRSSVILIVRFRDNYFHLISMIFSLKIHCITHSFMITTHRRCILGASWKQFQTNGVVVLLRCTNSWFALYWMCLIWIWMYLWGAGMWCTVVSRVCSVFVCWYC